MVTRPFPLPGLLVQGAYRELHIAQYGTDEERAALGRIENLDRPWQPFTCKPAVRQQLWQWLDEVVVWVNHEYGWGVDLLIPPCWPAHPHIAHELAVLADQRRSAAKAVFSDPLEEWHRYALPLFLDRMVARLGGRCVNKHDDWPAAPRHRAYDSDQNRRQRHAWFAGDLNTAGPPAAAAAGGANAPANAAGGPPRLVLVDLETGEAPYPDQPNGGR